MSALQSQLIQHVRFMACFYLQTIEKHYRVSQRTVRRWCEDSLIPGAYRPTKKKQWRVRKPKDFDRWQAEVMKTRPTAEDRRTCPLLKKASFSFQTSDAR